ncbi:endoglucanase 8 [Ricinus communis]|uniref:Endoglucanase n=1 Tax=Ricinus communis TaxID=3988 RepID=B9R9R2_RICCO|nr:endoglucanase 8 [Ricinus communis]EEF51539.1 endo-1,4-beta-glucanase, putative [Ricinus communis]|eukprot:XP_002510937.1 endoglucanase 8 [Ricinus communis]
MVKEAKARAMLLLLGLIVMNFLSVASQDYGEALSKCILFFEGQRSGKLPSTQRMNWREDSALQDGSDIGVDLTGGYYDAGDNIKFNFPMAFTTTLLAWSVLEFGQLMGTDMKYAVDAIRWSTDYFMKATSVPGSVVAQIGEPINDHNCWERPEDMDTQRTTYVVNQTYPGSEVSAEIAAALTASSLVFKTIDSEYSNLLLQRAFQVFDFADKYQGSYDSSVGPGVCPFYCDSNGYKDELAWGASWLFKATNDNKYWDYIQQIMNSSKSMVITRTDDVVNSLRDSFTEFGWDSKQGGINVLVSGLVGNGSDQNPFIQDADKLVCSILPESPTKFVTYSAGGLLFKPGSSNLQHTTALSFLLLVYSRYLEQSRRVVKCGNVVATPTRLVAVAKGQVDYILGRNPLGMSYMVGYGNKYPQRIHHRGSTLPMIQNHPQHIGCKEGTPYFESNNPNPNVLVGAIVGGPDINDQYVDDRLNVSQSEPTTYINAPFVGVLAYLKAHPSKYAIS